MKYKHLILSLSLIMLGPLAHAEEIGSVDTVFKMIGPDHKIVVEAFDDPDVKNVTCYVSRAKTGGIKGGLGLAEDTSDAAISCQQVGPIELSDRIKNGKAQGEVVFKKRTSLVFKSLQVVRFYDAKRNALAYLAYSDKVVEGSPKNAISAVPVMPWRQEQRRFMQRETVWLVEDEQGIADTLVYMLQQEGFAVEVFERGLPVLDKARQQVPDVMILDVGLPDISGFELCRQLLALHPALPVLFLTARSEEVDRLLGLEIGADDYVAKPFSPREVCARVRTLLRRVKKFSSPSPVIRIGHFELNEPAAQISWFDTPLTLTRYEFLLLKTLLKSPGRVWSRQQLMDSVWEDAQDTYDRTVDTHIKTLRAKLRAINPDLSPINTHRGMGYSLRGL